jgi:hypothetical protein
MCRISLHQSEGRSPVNDTLCAPPWRHVHPRTLPAGCPSMEVIEQSSKENVAITHEIRFYNNGVDTDTMRLSSSNVPDEKIVNDMHWYARGH